MYLQIDNIELERKEPDYATYTVEYSKLFNKNEFNLLQRFLNFINHRGYLIHKTRSFKIRLSGKTPEEISNELKLLICKHIFRLV